MSRIPPPPAGFTLGAFENEEDDIPPPPEGFSLGTAVPEEDPEPVDRPTPRARQDDPAPPPVRLEADTIGRAVDGDTFALTSGGRLRLYGVDAPELDQPGYDRQGNRVLIGQEAREAASRITADGDPAIGAERDRSYGRSVAPVTVDGADLGQALARQGEVLAAPEYLKGDPQRRFEYMQAERLARQNGLGVHDTMFQQPSDYRHNPQPEPDRETVARFWDTPTPFAGLRPEAEKRLLELTYDPKVPLEEVAAYAKENGGVLDMASAQASRNHFLKYGQSGGVAYKDKPRILTDQGDGVTGAAVRGVGTGALAGGLDEVGAVVDTLGLTDGRENVFNSDRRLADIWANNQQQNSAILGFDEQEHPYASTAGELAGGLVAPFGAGAKTIPELARVGAAYGAASGFLGTDGGLGERAIGAAVGAPVGGLVGAGAGKALEVAAPLARRAIARVSGNPSRGIPSPSDIPMSNLSPEDLDSPLPNDLIAEGKAAMEGNVSPSVDRSRDYLELGQRAEPGEPTQPVEAPSIMDRSYPGPVPIADPLGTRARESYNRSIGDLWQLPSDQLDDLYLRSKRAEADQLRRAMDIIGIQPNKRIASNLGQDDFSWDRVASMIEREATASGREIPEDAERLLNPRWGDAPADSLPMSEDVDAVRQAHLAGGDRDEQMLASEIGWALRDLHADQVGRVIAGEGDAASQARMATVRLGYQRMAELGVPANEIPSRINDAMVANGVRPETAQELTESAVQALREGGRVRNGLAGPAQPMAPEVRDRNWINIDDVPAPTPRSASDVMAMDAEPAPSISADVARLADAPQLDRPTPMDQPLSEAQRRAMAERIDPRDIVPIPSNEVGSVEELAARDAGRFAPATAPNERAELTRQTVRTYNGAEVPKVGPIDLVGWLRLRGGLQDQRGELSHMGLNNAARRGMDFVGQEARFGPLVNEQGMRLDDAAEAAWEAGYFPDNVERPSVNEFLDALRSTHEGRARNFLPEDLPEIDRFNAAQQERYALEQQRFESNEPILRDKSMPADEPQPFAPPEAYEEWGVGGGPDFAGNIRLEKLETPQDIRRALDFTDKRIGFDSATRGRVTQVETERLAAELNMTPDALIARRQGQAFNAEEALAARQILAKSGNELVNAAKRIQGLDNPGDEMLADFRQKWVRHVAIQEQVSGMTAEAGRALQQFRQAASSRAVRGEVLSALVRGGGGLDNIKEAAERIVDASEVSPGVFNTLTKKAMGPKWRNRVSELYVNFLLSWPQTHVVNVTSNTLTALAQVPEHAAAAGLGKVREMIARKAVDRVTGSEVGARAFGLLQGAKEGAALFSHALRTGEPSDFVSKVEGQEYKAIPGLLGEIIRTPTRLLTAEDELFKGIARRMELNGQAVRMAHKEGLKGEAAKNRIAELVAEPTDDMLERANDYARYLTFQSPLSGTAQDISNISNRNIAAKFFLPFVRTPTNLLKFAIERSAAAPALPSWRKAVMAGGATRDLAVAKALVGTGMGYAMYQGAQAGLVTGAAPSDPKKARLLYANGWKPYSFKIGDTYYSYKRLDPFSTTIGVAADLATLPEGMSARQREDKATLLVASIMGNLANKTWLSGISDVVGALHDPERNADNMMQRLVGSLLIPNVIAGTARTIDPVQRETETIGDALQARTPGLRDDLLPRRDIWGNVVENEGGVGPDFLSPVQVSTALKDPVNKALLQTDYAPGYPRKEVNGRELSPQEYDRYQELAGKRSHAALIELVTSPAWKVMDADTQAEVAAKAVNAARKAVRTELFGEPEKAGKARPKPGRGSEGQDIPPPPPGFSRVGPEADNTGEAAGVNVYRDLQEAIPGVRFTSGFRDPKYQEDMRRRGYKPANNSAHLDGSALDMLPPEGKSMLWLKTRVRRMYPEAKLLIHDGHLHATFPGYFGAPVLGGARGAGLKNPYEGMPPPPPGFKVVQ